MKRNFLTESVLKEKLRYIFPKHEFIHNRKVPVAQINKRLDFRNDDLKLIIELKDIDLVLPNEIRCIIE